MLWFVKYCSFQCFYFCLLDTSFVSESGVSDDYAIPPDAISCSGDSSEWSSLVYRATANSAVIDSPSRSQRQNAVNDSNAALEKSGHLAKLGGKFKTWRRKWFQLSNGKLKYWKSQVRWTWKMYHCFSLKSNPLLWSDNRPRFCWVQTLTIIMLHGTHIILHKSQIFLNYCEIFSWRMTIKFKICLHK